MSPESGVDIEPLVISAPFGNYLRPEGTTATLGTFTAVRRGGRPAAFGRALLTVRYYPKLGAWVNRIGLRNPGIDALGAAVPRHGAVSRSIVSIHGFTPAEWQHLLSRVEQIRPAAVELNISCPNVGELSWPPGLFALAVATGVRVIVKLPPIRFEHLAGAAAGEGVTWFHACNTLPVPGGGMSGIPLRPLSLSCVSWLRDEFGDGVRIIGGGGIRTPDDVRAYAAAGADRFAVGTLVMRPGALFGDRWIAPVRAAALEARAHATCR